MPKGPVTQTTPAAGSAYGITVQSQHPDEAWLFLNDWLGDMGMRLFWAQQALPARRSAMGYFLRKMPDKDVQAIQKSMEVAEVGRPLMPPGYATYKQILSNPWDQFVQLKIPASEFAERIRAGYQAVWDKR